MCGKIVGVRFGVVVVRRKKRRKKKEEKKKKDSLRYCGS